MYNKNKNQQADYEKQAIKLASPKIGEWIDKNIGSTDFEKWTETQWLACLHQVVIEFSRAMGVVTDDIPF